MQRQRVVALARRLWLSFIVLAVSAPAFGQDPPQDHQHDMASMGAPSSGWSVMQDGVFNAIFNHQGGGRGAQEVTALNWWMGMFTRGTERQTLTVSTMFSLDPLTAGRSGYAELFQVGESLDGQPLIDRQHPHDFFMQLSASWSRHLSDRTTLVIAGGPVGEPALGPVAFMHRASAAAIPLAPLSHHTFDSSHITFGVLTAGVTRGRWTVEGSVFNGREPDDNRWDFDLAAMDSISGRVWFRPAPAWALQMSSGRLVEAEGIGTDTVTRTTASVSWLRKTSERLSAVTVGWGLNQEGEDSHLGLFAEFSRQWGATLISSRAELVDREPALLLADTTGESHALVAAVTIAAERRLAAGSWFELAGGAAATLHGTPASFDGTYGAAPTSFQIYLQLRPPAARRMWEMRMAEPAARGHAALHEM